MLLDFFVVGLLECAAVCDAVKHAGQEGGVADDLDGCEWMAAWCRRPLGRRTFTVEEAMSESPLVRLFPTWRRGSSCKTKQMVSGNFVDYHK